MNLLRRIYYWPTRIRFRRRFTHFIGAHHTQRIFIFDIDNTLANTYPSLNRKYASESERYLSLEAFPSMLRLVQAINNSPGRSVLYLTARSYKMHQATLQWLCQQGFPASSENLILVSSPADKIELIRYAVTQCPRLWIVDDMSYNHERGEVKFYEYEIRLLLKMPVKYIGYETIWRFQNKK